MKKTFKVLLVATLIVTLILVGTVLAFGTESTQEAEIKVQFNGENILFTDASPKIINGRTMVPFRQILETMGAIVTYDKQTNTVLAKSAQMELSFVIGETDITITKDNKTVIKKMDVAPFVDGKLGRTYVPVRFMAESMSYIVGWDNEEKTAVIIEPVILFKNADQDFSIIAKLFSSDLDLTKPYRNTAHFDMEFALYDTITPAEGLTYSIVGDMSGIQQKTNADLLMNLMINAEILSIPIEQQAQMEEMLDLFEKVVMKVKMNGETGTMYMNSNLFTIMDPGYDDNTWLKMNFFEIYDDMGLDIRPWINLSYSETSMSEMLGTFFSSMGDYNVSTYQNTKTAYASLKKLIGNEALKQQTYGGITTYTLNLENGSVLDLGFNGKIIIKEKDDSLYHYDINGNGSVEGTIFILDISGDQKNQEMKMTFDQKDVIKMVL
ncbi:MAG: copper amine oxidase N-terminal domain-containing protein, partial [Eubacteriales bacterium]|nr:copper amine oxidase N-terminal domain-containing protein [Eubacteriales bacterium]